MSRTPSTSTAVESPSAGAAEFVPPSSGGVQVCPTGQGAPGLWESPPRTGNTSTHADTKRLNIGDSPLIKVVGYLGGFASAKTLHSTTPDDPALALFRTYADAKEFDRLERFCLERGAFARDADGRLRWIKDFTIALALQGRHVEALGALRDADWLTPQVGPRVLGRYRNQVGIMLGRLGRTSLALDEFGPAYQASRSAGDFQNCARVNHNRARALMTRGETAKAARYLKRALDYARANDDYRLELEVLESIREFGGMS